MKKTTADRLVGQYLRRLRIELRDLPADRRREIVSQFQEHIAENRLENDREEDVRAMLDRLGDPAVLGAEARDRFGVRRRGRGPLELTALVFILLAPVFLVGPAMVLGEGSDGLVAGVVLTFALALTLLWLSRLWLTTDKLTATALVSAGSALFLVLMRLHDGEAAISGLVVLLGLTPFVAAVVHLTVRMRRLGGAPALTV
ncbi:hypothetical protein WEI85_12355 [Actinomycetes bacterium KLBMP 9797]